MQWRWTAGAVLATVLAAGPVPAQEPVGEGVPAGSYVFIANESESVERAIDGAVSHMNFLVRAVARSRLRGSNLPVDRIDIEYPDGDVWISLRPADPPIVTPRDGTPVAHRRADGEVVEASTELGPERIRQTFVSEDGIKEIVFRRLTPHRLAMVVTVRSDRLREPMTYTWMFRPLPSDEPPAR